MRIRAVRPEFWTDPQIMSLDRDGRLLLIGLLNVADDDGRFLAEPRPLLGALFAGDPDVDGASVDRWLGSLESAKIIRRYRVRSVSFAVINGFRGDKPWGQRIDKPKTSSLPPPPQRKHTSRPASSTTKARTTDDEGSNDRRRIRDTSPLAVGSGIGRGNGTVQRQGHRQGQRQGQAANSTRANAERGTQPDALSDDEVRSSNTEGETQPLSDATRELLAKAKTKLRGAS